MGGYTDENTRLLCPPCDARIQQERGSPDVRASLHLLAGQRSDAGRAERDGHILRRHHSPSALMSSWSKLACSRGTSASHTGSSCAKAVATSSGRMAGSFSVTMQERPQPQLL